MKSQVKTPVCSTGFMNPTLKHFSKEEVRLWLKEMQEIDEVLSLEITANLTEFEKNQHQITSTLAVKFKSLLEGKDITSKYDIGHMEAYHGYTVFTYPDNGAKKALTGNKDLYYGIAKATLYGIAHEHYLSDAFNLILDGEGLFTGREEDKGKFPHFYHMDKLEKDVEIEIPIGMGHGHLVKKGKPIWFLFVQECGFKPELRCAGDFHPLNAYDLEKFGQDYE